MWASSSDRLALGKPAAGRNELRASDAERDQAIGRLRDRFAEGRLSQETFLYRMDVALKAKFPSELSELFTDLPREEQRTAAGGTGFRAWVRQMREQAAGRLSVPRRPARVRRPLVPPAYAVVPYQSPPRVVPAGDATAQLRAVDPLPLFLPRQEDRRFSIGRAPSCDFTVTDISVSRWHARLQKQEDDWLLSDLGSTNGTRLNGWKVTSAVPVRPGDQITFGNVAYVVKDNPGTPQDQKDPA
jgi:hypothetical protein